VRIFDARAATGTAILGPAPLSGEATISGSAAADVTAGIEALQYPDNSFNGEVTLRLILRDGTTELARDEALLRVAPWVMPSHMQRTEELYIVETSDNAAFVSAVSTIATNRGIPLRRTSNSDRWMQDTMEVGYSRMPGHSFHTVLKAVRRRGLRHYARTDLLGADYGYVEVNTSTAANTFDSHGNLEVSPPVQVSGSNYRLGRIYYGSGRGSTLFNAEFRQFLEAQRVQKPFPIDTAWLAVGHVDEVVSFVPSSAGSKGFSMLLSDTGEATTLLNNLRSAGHGSRTLFTGKSEEITVDDLLIELGRTAAGELGWANNLCQGRIDGIRTTMQTELGIVASDIVRIPALFIENSRSPRRVNPARDPIFDAHIPGMVNMLVITGATVAETHLVIARPFGPEVSGTDLIEQDVRTRLAPLGYGAGQIHFVDDYDTYHVKLGEVHCGTNSKRNPHTTPWWEQTDF
jgi:protein-arginine deiminase